LKLIITILATLIMFSCGSTPQASDTTEQAGPPWEKFSAPERDTYVLKHQCAKATSAVIDIMEWPLLSLGNKNNPSKAGSEKPGVVRFVKAVKEPGSNSVALVQYRVEKGNNVVELVSFMPSSNVAIMILDYNIFRAFKTGAASPGDVNALSLATGKYFCVYNINH